MFLIEKILMKKIMMKKILMKKNLINKIKHRMRIKKRARERYQNHSKQEKYTRLETDIKIFLKEKKKSFSIVMDVIGIFLRKKNQSKLGISEIII